MTRRLLALSTLSLALGCAGEIGDLEVDSDAAPIFDSAPAPDTAPAPDVSRPDAAVLDVSVRDVSAPEVSPVEDVMIDAPIAADVSARDVSAPDVMAVDVTPPPTCSATWVCTADRSARQRCVGGVTETVRCASGCMAGSAGAVCSCGTMSGFTVWNCLASGDLGRCQGGAWTEQSCMGHGCSARPTGVDDVCNGPPPPPGSLSCSVTQWWNSSINYEHVSSGWADTDLRMVAGSEVQLRHNSRLDRTGVYGWGYMPEFTDLTTGARFRFLHLRPQNQYATTVGRTYPAGFIVGLSGGNTADTGYPTYSTGQHLCVQTLIAYRSAFPTGRDACR